MVIQPQFVMPTDIFFCMSFRPPCRNQCSSLYYIVPLRGILKMPLLKHLRLVFSAYAEVFLVVKIHSMLLVSFLRVCGGVFSENVESKLRQFFLTFFLLFGQIA